jgi:hypothetical protein
MIKIFKIFNLVPLAKMAESSSSSSTNKKYILISFSNANLLEQQKNFFLIKKSQSNTLKALTIKNKYEAECRQFFNTIDKKHASKGNTFKLFIKNELLTNEPDPIKSFSLIKVQFLKLCNLNKINEILSLTATNANANNDVKFKEIANDYIKNATHEILLYNDEEEKINKKKESHAQSVIKFRQDSSATNTTTYTTISLLTPTTISTNFTNNETILNSILISKEKLLDMFWSVVPREDLLLAVIVPLTIICSMCILTIVVACLLHMFNRNYKENKKKLILLNTTTTSSNSCNSSRVNNTNNNKVVASSSCTSSDSTKLGKLLQITV